MGASPVRSRSVLAPHNIPDHYASLELVEDGNQSLQGLGNAIRQGASDSVLEIIEMESNLDLLDKPGLSLNMRLRKKKSSSLEFDQLEVTPFHLAILAQDGLLVQLILDKMYNFKVDGIRNLLEAKTCVKFGDDQNNYIKEDQALHQINCLHLAGRYHPGSLLIIFRFLRQHDLIHDIEDLLKEADPLTGQSILHMSCNSATSVKILLYFSPDLVHAVDKDDLTPLHLAAQEGEYASCKALLEFGADPNSIGNSKRHTETPLHKATSRFGSFL